MTINRFFVRDVTILTPPPVATGYGNGVEPDYDNAVPTLTKGWLHQLAESAQQTATRDAQISTHVLRLPVGTVIDATCRVTVDGETFDVDGPPNRAWRPDGEHHVRVPLSRVDG